jgi:hypothetical protein
MIGVVRLQLMSAVYIKLKSELWYSQEMSYWNLLTCWHDYAINVWNLYFKYFYVCEQAYVTKYK